MPTYEYRCNACKREFEIQQKMSDADLVNCEACGQPKLEKLISWTSVRSNTWQSALTSDNPKEAMKGLRAVDTAPPKKEKPARPARRRGAGSVDRSGRAARGRDRGHHARRRRR